MMAVQPGAHSSDSLEMDLNSFDRRKDVLAGKVCLIMVFSALFFSIVCLFIDRLLSLTTFGFFIAQNISYFAFKKGRFRLSKYICLVAFCCCLILLYLQSPSQIDIKVLFFGISTLPLLVFDRRDRFGMFFFVMLGFLIYGLTTLMHFLHSDLQSTGIRTIVEIMMGTAPISFIGYMDHHDIQHHKVLVQKELHLKSIFDAAETAIITINSRGVITRCNQFIAKILAWEPHEIIGKNISILMPAEVAEHHDQYIETYLKTGISKMIGVGRRIKALHKNGQEVPVYLSISKFYFDGETFFTGTMADLSEVVRQELALQAQKDELNELLIERTNEIWEKNTIQERLNQQIEQQLNLVKYAPIAITMLDTHLNFIAWSQAWEKDFLLTGLLKGGTNFREISSFFPNRWRNLFAEVVAGRTIGQDEDFFLDAAIKPQWLKWIMQPWYNNSGNIGGIIIATENITKKKIAEMQVQKLTHLMMNTIDWIWESDNKLNLISSQGRLGKFLAVVPGDSLAAFFESGPFTIDFVQRILANDHLTEPILNQEIPIKTKMGDEAILSVSLVPIESEDGVISGYHGIARDITELKTSMKNLIIAKQNADAANRSKSLFLANISHEVRTPLHGVLNFTDLAIKDLEAQEYGEVKDSLGEVLVTGHRLLAILNDLLDLSKLEAGKIVYVFDETSLSGVVQNVHAEFAQLIGEKRLNFIEQGDSQLTINGDGQRLHQVIANLISNAIKFAFPDTDLVVEIHESQTHVQFEVRNKGIGIPETELEAIFQKFVQSTKTDRGAGGTGLGLSICEHIIRDHGGRIWASMVNDWTVFTFELPKNFSGERSAEDAVG